MESSCLELEFDLFNSVSADVNSGFDDADWEAFREDLNKPFPNSFEQGPSSENLPFPYGSDTEMAPNVEQISHVSEQGPSSQILPFLNDVEMAPNVFEQGPSSGNFSNNIGALFNQEFIPLDYEQALQLPDYQPDMSQQQQLLQFEQHASVTHSPSLYNFRLLEKKYPEVQKVTKSARYLYSNKLKKFFFNIGKPCPVYFKVDHPLPAGCSVVCMAKFKDPRLAGNPVKQCPGHTQSSTTDRFVNIVGEGNLISYHQTDAEIGHHDLASQSIFTTSLVNPTEFIVGYEFNCLTSCQKKGFVLVFQLTHAGHSLLGEFEVDTQVCTCTGRAMKTQELNLKQRSTSSSAVASSPSSPQSPSTSSAAIATAPIKIDPADTLEAQRYPRIKNIGYSSTGKEVVQVRVSQENQDTFKDFINRLQGLKLIDNNELAT